MYEFVMSLESGPNVDLITLAWLAVISMLGSYLIREKLGAMVLGLACYPLFLGFSALIFHCLQHFAVFNVKKLDEWFIWTIGSGFIGIVVSFATILACMRVKNAVSERRIDRLRQRTAMARSR